MGFDGNNKVDGEVDLRTAYRLVTRIFQESMKSSRAQTYEIDCTDVTGFSSFALIELSKLRREVLGPKGCDLKLKNLPPSVKANFRRELFLKMAG